MAKVNLKIAELRKYNQIGQQELAEVLGVTYQSVSKWETGITMPDITLLPIQKAKETFKDSNISSDFIESGIYNFNSNKEYDFAICQACLRHLNRPMEALANMVEVVREGGMIVCVEVNRE